MLGQHRVMVGQFEQLGFGIPAIDRFGPRAAGRVDRRRTGQQGPGIRIVSRMRVDRPVERPSEGQRGDQLPAALRADPGGDLVSPIGQQGVNPNRRDGAQFAALPIYLLIDLRKQMRQKRFDLGPVSPEPRVSLTVTGNADADLQGWGRRDSNHGPESALRLRESISPIDKVARHKPHC